VEGFNRVKRAWLKKAYRLNENISLNMNSKKIIGKFIGIDNSGQIILKLNTEKKKIFNVGDILG
ncbi:MAG: biotin--[acetyl-CoA-carboxylase] ligase, partial [Alphaproteobacteria bacterium]|nr:biotin--[acetyl-CoA-carboxylase] ligase [Alphaproteobacteria bacterium]